MHRAASVVVRVTVVDLPARRETTLRQSANGNSQATPGAGSEGFLRFIDVKKSYDRKTLVVKGFDLDVAKGEFITLLGPSGSGKTTVLMLLAGFESVTGGDILIGGAPITRTAPNKRNIGIVFQNYALFPHMTVAENLAYPLKARKVGSRHDQSPGSRNTCPWWSLATSAPGIRPNYRAASASAWRSRARSSSSPPWC